MTPAQRKASQRIREWRTDPIKFVRDVFHAEPDAWQLDALNLMAKPGRKRIAMKACAGPGKTAVLAWAGWHRLACFGAPNEHPKGAAVSCTTDNLRNNLWSELARWQNESKFLLGAFQWTKERIVAADHPETWFLGARGWAKDANPETVGRTLSGLHSRFPFYLIDESGDIHPQMLRSAEQGLTSCEDGLIITAGNTTSQTGMLYEVTTRGRAQWDVISITGDPDDAKRSPRVDLAWAQEQIALYGRENPWVMAYILGQFPPGSINALLSVEDVEKAFNIKPIPDMYEWAQKRIGVDVARFGDDRTVQFPRQGRVAFLPIVYRFNRDDKPSMVIATRVTAQKIEWGSEAEFFDDTVGWAHGAVDIMGANGYSPYAIQFNGTAPDQRYYNMRSYMWFKMAEWVKDGGCLPPLAELVGELTGPTYTFKDGKFLLEPKDMVKKRLGKSPDLADALALTFALPDCPGGMVDRFPRAERKSADYDPYAHLG